MIDLILQNATNVRIDGVIDPFITPKGNIAGQFLSDYHTYDFEIEGNSVYYRQSYRQDSKGKKCPRGYWIPKDHTCRQGMMTPSAKGKLGGVKAALATAAIAGVAAGGVMVAKNRMSGGGAIPTQPEVEIPIPPAQPNVEVTAPQKKGLGARAKELAGDRRVQIGAGVVGVGTAVGGTALALGKRKKKTGAETSQVSNEIGDQLQDIAENSSPKTVTNPPETPEDPHEAALFGAAKFIRNYKIFEQLGDKEKEEFLKQSKEKFEKSKEQDPDYQKIKEFQEKRKKEAPSSNKKAQEEKQEREKEKKK